MITISCINGTKSRREVSMDIDSGQFLLITDTFTDFKDIFITLLPPCYKLALDEAHVLQKYTSFFL